MSVNNVVKCVPRNKGLNLTVQLYILSVLGFMVNYMLRTDINIALLSMVIGENGTRIPGYAFPPEFHWTIFQQGNLQSGFYVAYVLGSAACGLFINRIGASKAMGGCHSLTAVFALTIPFVAKENYIYILIVRTIQGFLLGLSWPAYFAVLARWTAPHERSRFVSATQGMQLGTGITYMVLGNLSEHFGWHSLFYFTGIVGVVWGLLWFWLITEDPHNHPTISQKELEFIRSKTSEMAPSSETTNPPWWDIFTSVPLMGISVTNFGRIWILSLLHMYGPQYMQHINKVGIVENGVLSGIPFILSYFVGTGTSWLADSMVKREVMSPTNVRRFFTAVAQLVPAACMLAVGYTKTATQFTFLITVSICAQTLATSGSMVSIISMAPNYSAAVTGYVQCVFMTSSFLLPLAQSAFVTDDGNPDQWRNLFIASGILGIASYIPYHMSATEEVQPWNDPKPRKRTRTFSREANSGSVTESA